MWEDGGGNPASYPMLVRLSCRLHFVRAALGVAADPEGDPKVAGRLYREGVESLSLRLLQHLQVGGFQSRGKTGTIHQWRSGQPLAQRAA